MSICSNFHVESVYNFVLYSIHAFSHFVQRLLVETFITIFTKSLPNNHAVNNYCMHQTNDVQFKYCSLLGRT